MTTYYVTPAGAGTKAGTSWANAYGLSEFDTAFASASANDIFYVYSGTYDCTGIAIAYAGTNNGVQVIGCSDQASPPTWATGTDRPLFTNHSTGNFGFTNTGTNVSQYHTLANVRVTGLGSYGVMCKQYTLCLNCYSETTSGCAFSWSDISCRFFNCEARSTGGSGHGFYPVSTSADNYPSFLFCYAHGFSDSAKYGFYGISYSTISFCIADDCYYGFRVYSKAIAQNCTANDCNFGFMGYHQHTIINCNITNCSYGIDAPSLSNELTEFNNFYNNTNNTNRNATVGRNSTTNDPDYTDDTNEDFSLDPASDCIDAGFAIEVGVG